MGVVNSTSNTNKLISIQTELKELGLYHDKLDGLFGNGSFEAFKRLLGGNVEVINPHTFAAKDVFESLQKALTNAGFDTKGVDGIWGKNSQYAFTQAVTTYKKSLIDNKDDSSVVNTEQNKSNNFKFGSLSEKRLVGVKPQLVKVIRRALELSPEDFGVREGLRTIEQQRENVRKGVSQTMKSKHLTGDAVDIYPSKLPEGWQKNPKVWLPILKATKQAGDELGVKLRFGINWKNDPSLPIETKFIDAPHVELA